MLGNAIVHPTLAVTNLEAARDFYGNKVGLTEVTDQKSTGEPATRFECGNGTFLYVYQRGEPSGSTATACSFEVDNLDEVMTGLRGNGVAFEDYDFPGLKTENGVAQMGDIRGCWFKDPDGNILAISEIKGATTGATEAEATAN